MNPLIQIIEEKDGTWSVVDYETQSYSYHLSGGKDLQSIIASCNCFISRDRIQIIPRQDKCYILLGVDIAE